MERTYRIEAVLGLRENEPIRYSQSDNEHPGPPSSPARRAARCGRISTGEEAQKQFNKTQWVNHSWRLHVDTGVKDKVVHIE